MFNWQNQLYYGDNLQILREYIQDESIDLIYLDPPFNSNRNYNVLFKDESGHESEAQITAFEDTWHWDRIAEDTYHELIENAPAKVSAMIGALRQFIGTNQVMAYLVMMTIRLIELHRVLKSTGSLYLHCDPTASHYLKIVLDTIFDIRHFRNEIIWHYSGWNAKLENHFNKRHDVLLFYSKSDIQLFNSYSISWESENEYVKIRKQKIRIDENDDKYVLSDRGSGKRVKRYLRDAMDYGKPIDDVWEIPKINNSSKEYLGYPTQKPIELLARIIESCSDENDIILDPFCGCGTAIHTAQKLKRRWIGIDITHLSISLLKYRLKNAFNLIEKKDYKVIGEPISINSAQELAKENRYQFQWWALSLVQAKPINGDGKKGKKGKDRGIDGVINFIDIGNEKPQKILIQVKSGKVKSGDIRDLRGTIEREKAAIGIFITLEEPTRDMNKEAVSSGYYKSVFGNQEYPKIQILTIKQLLDGDKIQMPPIRRTFKEAKKELKENKSGQKDLF